MNNFLVYSILVPKSSFHFYGGSESQKHVPGFIGHHHKRPSPQKNGYLMAIRMDKVHDRVRSQGQGEYGTVTTTMRINMRRNPLSGLITVHGTLIRQGFKVGIDSLEKIQPRSRDGWLNGSILIDTIGAIFKFITVMLDLTVLQTGRIVPGERIEYVLLFWSRDHVFQDLKASRPRPMGPRIVFNGLRDSIHKRQIQGLFTLTVDSFEGLPRVFSLFKTQKGK